ncbi:MAG: ABC transporter ATP-binding protein [Armatimonadetes bacterium]|nr:ABC transporter ATP-binding protein [Armatimonadota bacterium]
MAVASLHQLTVKYGDFVALDDFTVDISEGCVGLLGPNGAGKTTLIKTLLGFLTPTAGSGSVLGTDLSDWRRIRQLVGYMPEQDCHIPGMSGVAFVAYAGELAGMPKEQALRRAHEVLEYCGLGEARYRNVETYSTGMRQRIKLAQAIVHGPKLLLLDEPTNGLDPAGRVEMLELVREVSHGKGLSVLVCSHLLPDIEKTCDEALVILRGKLREQGLIKNLKKVDGHPVEVELGEPSPEFETMIVQAGMPVIHRKLATYRLESPGSPQEALHRVLATAAKLDLSVRGFHVAERSLEEAFLEAIN